MAGSYPDAPGERIAYDEDGTIVWRADALGAGTGTIPFTGLTLPPTELSSTTKTEYNDEDSVTVYSQGGPNAKDMGFAWVFPEKRDVYGFFGFNKSNNGDFTKGVEASTDSKNGISGSWSTLGQPVVAPGGTDNYTVENAYREFIDGDIESTGVRSVRVSVDASGQSGAATNPMKSIAFHWYGSIADGANPDRLIFIDDDTGLEYTEVHDWGDIPRGSVHDKDIHLLNNSATLAASSNVITFEALYGPSGSWYTIQDNSAASPSFSSTLTINGPIAAGARYPSSTSLVVRLTAPTTGNLGPAAARLQLVTGSWA